MTDQQDDLLQEGLQQQSAADLHYETETPEEEVRLAADDVPAALEALLFAAGDPISLEKLQQITGVSGSELQQILSAMTERYQRDRQRGIVLREIDGSYLLATKPGQRDVLQRLFQPRHRPPLSQAAYETLAIIAYNQPVTRAQVEAVRGVNSDSIIARLIERNLIHEAGTLDAPGRPQLFATTDQFLLDFGLCSVKELPPMELLMYGTLRDFDESLDEAAGRHRDKQMTIDQLVQAFVPADNNNGKTGVAVGQAGDDEKTAADAREDDINLADTSVWQVSEALFGDTENADDD
ncbi:MAG: SMC-Scp complex subunit ScpB [Clostridiaceae bacterium]|nr:SMC-Scp complex subunit ScpB [Clostridiaceae bacterium]